MSADPATPGPGGAAGDGAHPGAAPGERPVIPRAAYALAIATFFVVAATNILTPLLPQIREDFGVSISAAGWIVGSYGIARLAIDLPAGFLLGRVGPWRLSIIGVVLLVVGAVVGFGAGSVEVLVGSRLLSGAAVAILGTVVLTALSASATTANRGKIMSLFHVANNVGIAFYPMVGGLLGTFLDWRATFVVLGVLGLVAGVLLLPVLPRIDFSRGRKAGGGADESRVLEGRTKWVAFAATNVGVAANMIHRHGFRNTVMPLYAATVLGLGGVSIATAIALMSITGLMVATPGGMLGDRIGRRRVIQAGLATVAVGDLLFLLTGDLVSFLVAAALIGFGDFFTSSQTALLSEIVPAKDRPFSLSAYRFSSDLGSLVGPILLASIMDAASAQAAIVTAAGILFAASFAAWALVPRPPAAAPARTPVGGTP